MLLIALLVGGLNLGHAYHDHVAVANGWSRCVGLGKTEHGYLTICVRDHDDTGDIFLWKPGPADRD
ncbi:MAG: hypothetical protein OXG35_16880 [Acidobacteria bacterium]|nr:hypothetical protein [Acidobacteriota bacterium]